MHNIIIINNIDASSEFSLEILNSRIGTNVELTLKSLNQSLNERKVWAKFNHTHSKISSRNLISHEIKLSRLDRPVYILVYVRSY